MSLTLLRVQDQLTTCDHCFDAILVDYHWLLLTCNLLAALRPDKRNLLHCFDIETRTWRHCSWGASLSSR